MENSIDSSQLIRDECPSATLWNKAWNQLGSVHCFEILDKRFVLDVGSGVVTEVDHVAWEVVQELNDGITPYEILKRRFLTPDRKHVEMAIEELGELYQTGELFSADPMEEPVHPANSASNLCLMLSDDCNLRCGYCFAFKGKAGPQRFMTEKTARQAVDFLFRNAKQGRAVSLSFFGGEPLLNFSVLRATTEYAAICSQKAKCPVHFNITTNGTLLTKEVRNFLARYPDISIIVSLDGGEEIHDRHRKFADGTGSHAIVCRKLRALQDDQRIAKRRYSIRGTFSGAKCDLVSAVDAILGMGIYDLSVEPAITKGDRFEILASQLENIKRNYERLALFYLDYIKQKRRFTFFHFQVAMQHIGFVEPMYRQCGAGVGYLAVATNGTLYPCHRFVGQQQYQMGRVDQGVTNDSLRSMFLKISVNRKPICRTCWIKYHCGGGCHAHAAKFNGNIYEPYTIECELMKHRLKIGAYLQTVLTDATDDAWLLSDQQALQRPEYLQQEIS